MRTHKMIATMLALLFVLNCTLVTVSAANDSGTCGPDAVWSFNSQIGTLTISGTGSIDGYEKLTAVNGSLGLTAAAPWKIYASEITSIVIGEGITSIGESAFKDLDHLESLQLPSTLTSIENYAFSHCGSLERVVIPENVRIIGCNAFLGRCGETKPYIYFLGNAPSAKSEGTMGRSFSNNTTLYYLSGASGWSGSAWNGYQTTAWNGSDFLDPLFGGNTGNAPMENDPIDNGGGTPWTYPQEPAWSLDIMNDYGEKVEVLGTKYYSYAYDVIDAVNALRRQNGLRELSIDDKLMETAMQRAAECSIYYSHTRPNDTSCLDIFPAATVRGENIAAGQSSPAVVMSDWTSSPGHYANMVNGDYTSIGVGCFYIDGHYYWAQSFTNGQPSNHTRSRNTQTTVSVPVSSNHFILSSDSSTISVRVGESVPLPVQLINSGFYNTAATIQIKPSNCSSPSIVTLSGQPVTITGKRPGSGAVTVKFENGMSTSFYINVTSPYTDVSESDWYYDAVSWADGRGIIDSASQSTFGASLPMSRGMTAMLLYRLEDSPSAVWPAPFTDVDANYAEPVSWAASCGLMSGYGNNRFGPIDTLTRGQMAAVLYRYAQYKGIDTSSRADISRYSDAGSVSSYAFDAICWANYEGLLAGTSSTMLSPARTITRAEVAVIFMRFCNKFNI